MTLPATDGVAVIAPRISGARVSLRVTRKLTAKRLPANGREGTATGGAITGFAAAEAPAVAVGAAAVIAQRTRPNNPTEIAARIEAMIPPEPTKCKHTERFRRIARTPRLSSIDESSRGG